MNTISKFFLFCSGIDNSILEKCPTDKNKYVGIGATIFFTGVLAFFSAGYALFTVFDNVALSVIFGLFWGAMIFNLDRYIVSSMKMSGSKLKDFGFALPRILLAVLLAVVISKPLELKIFEKEINSEMVLMEQEVFKGQEDKVKLRYQTEVDGLKSQIGLLKKEINEKTAVRDNFFKIAQMEADGTGGSGNKSLGPIYKLKKADADKAQSELDNLIALNQPTIAAKQLEISELNSKINTQISGLDRDNFGGLAARMDALTRLTEKSNTILLANIFVMLLFVSIETAPIFVKLISKRSPYDYVLHEIEHVFEMANLQKTSLLATEVKNLILEKREIKTHKTKALVTAEKARINAKLKKEMDKLIEEHGSLDAVVFDI